MKFTIFKWCEAWIKPCIYVLILISTAGLIAGYCFIKDDGGLIAFAVSISYALIFPRYDSYKQDRRIYVGKAL